MDSAYILREAEHTLEELLAPYGIERCGVILMPPDRWQSGADHHVTRPHLPSLHLVHDEREAPYATATGQSATTHPLPTHVSITDEQGLVLVAWAEPAEDAHVLGLGTDLASTSDFAGHRGETFNHLLFTERERKVASAIAPEREELACAFAFSAKEAAFKACAAPLRRWYLTHDEELSFEVRDFELTDAYQETGSARKGDATRAMEALGISSIRLGRTTIEDMALTFAVALDV